MHISKLSILTGVLVIALAVGGCWAGPPTTGSGGAGTQWYNPAQWQMPAMPWSGEPPRIRKKPQGMMSEMNQSAKRGWAKTKAVLNPLNPARMFVSDPKPASSKPKPGFWESIFGPAYAPQDVRTVNDFLSQPHPR